MFLSRKFVRKYLVCACCIVCAVTVSLIGTKSWAHAQTVPTELSFDAATIKPVDPSHHFDPNHFGDHVTKGGASYWSVPVRLLVADAYSLRLDQIVSPEWTEKERFDVETKFPEGARKEDAPRMLQALLKDRFKLAFHIEKRELPGFVLVVGKSGEKLKPAVPDRPNTAKDSPAKPGDSDVEEENANTKITRRPDGSALIRGKKGTDLMRFDQETRSMHWELSKTTMEEFAVRLDVCVGPWMHLIKDQTGIKGFYQVVYDCPLGTPRPPTGGADTGMLPSDPQDDSSLNRSLNALGLRLEKRKFLQDIYVVDHVERPSEN